MRTAINSLVSFWCILLLLGCSWDNSVSHDTPPPTPQFLTCDIDADCDAYNRNCQHGLCVDGPKGAEVRVSAAIFPPPDHTALGPLTLNQQSFSLDERIHVALGRTLSVNGKVSQLGKEKLGKVQLFFSRQDDLSGRRYTNNASTDAQGNFSIQLPEGDYTVTLRTEWEDFPEHNTTLHVSQDLEGSLVYFDLPRESDYVRWTGRLVRLDENNDTHPVSDVTLWAQDTHSTARSSLGVSDENGVFTFYLAKSVESFQIQLRQRTVTQAGRMYAIPSSTFPTLEAEYGEESGAQEIPGYELNLGRIKPSVRISGIVLDHKSQPVSGARVFAQTRVSESNDLVFEGGPTRATIDHSETTDLDGRFSFLFPPYDGISITAFDNQYGPQLSDARRILNLGTDDPISNSEIELQLKAPIPVTFDIRDAFEQPVEYFEATFDLVDSELLSSRHYDARTEEFGGVFSVRDEMIRGIELPAAYWNITIAPRADYTLPRFWFTQELTEESSTIHAYLPHGVVAGFLVQDDQGQPVRGATVELWAEDTFDAKRSTPLLLGTAQSDAKGHANVLIPYLLQPERWTGVLID